MTGPRVLFSTGSLYVFDLWQCFELAADAEFDGIEIMCDERWSTRDPDYLKRLSEQFGLPIPVAHTPFSPKTPGWRDPHDEIARIRHTLALAETIGAETIVVHVPRKRGQITVQINRRTFRLPWRMVVNPVKRWIEQELPGVQAQTRVKIALENMPVNRVAGREINPAWWNEVETWPEAHTWLTLDTTHWATKQVDPVVAYQAAGKRVCHIHLSNYDGDEHRLPHKGSLNLKAFLRALKNDGFDGTVSLELSPQALAFKEPYLLKRHLRDSLNFTRDHLR